MSDTLKTLEQRGLTVGWLARRIGVDDGTLRYQFAEPERLRLRIAYAISGEIGIPLEVAA